MMNDQIDYEGVKAFRESVINDIEFYDSFLSVNESTINSVKNHILNSDIIKKKEHFNFFLKLLNKSPILRPKSTKYFDSILKDLIPFIKNHFSTFEISTIFQSKSQVLLLIEEKILQVNHIYSKSMDDLSFFIFFYNDLKKKFSNFCQSKINENKIIKDIIEKTDWEEFKNDRKKFINQNEIAISIRHDDVNSFIEKVYRFQHKINNQNSIDIQTINPDELNFDIPIEHSIIETTNPVNNLQKMPKLIEYSAFYGSIKIFKFLFTKLCKNESLKNSSDLAFFASIGGNVDIIQFLINEKFEFNERCQIGAIEFHRYEVSNLICPHPNFLTLYTSVYHNNFKFFNDHLEVLEDSKSYQTDSFLRLFDFSFKNLPRYFLNFLFRLPKGSECLLFSRIAKCCDLTVIKSAVENINEKYLNINQNDKNGFNALHYACLNESKDVCRFLLNQPTIDPNSATRAQNVKVKYYEMTPLHLVSLNKNVEICELLLSHPKIDVNKPIKRNNITPLMTACLNDSYEIVNLLLNQNSIDLNYIENEGQSALHFAVTSHSLRSIQYLISHHINLNTKRKEKGITPFLLAVENNELEIVRYFCSLKTEIDFEIKDIFGAFNCFLFIKMLF